MSVDIFNTINSLRTDPTTFKASATTLAKSAVLNSYPNTALTAYKWSNALSMAALEYVNRKSINAAPEASIFFTARNKYASTVCGTAASTKP